MEGNRRSKFEDAVPTEHVRSGGMRIQKLAAAGEYRACCFSQTFW